VSHLALISEAHFNSIESLETIRQNIHMTDTLISSLTPMTVSDPHRAFNFQSRSYQLGQWVDVKDTINQWLEAQVIDIRPNQVCIHYNGWGSQWDEWLDNDSPRIALFRNHTLQYSTSRYVCPSPNIPPDAENAELPQYNPNLRHLLVQNMAILDKLKKTMGQFLLVEEQRKKRQLAAQLAPLVDRIGRILIEFGPHLLHIAAPQAIKDDTSEEPEESKRTEEPLQVSLIANPGDVALVTNLLDRVLFGNTPTLELHVHSDLNDPLIPSNSRDSINEIPIPNAIPIPELESVGTQTNTKVECEIQTEAPQTKEIGVSTSTYESIGVSTEDDKRLTEATLVVPKSRINNTLNQYRKSESTIYSTKNIVKTGITIPTVVLKKRRRIQ